jgi:hypothetical protein
VSIVSGIRSGIRSGINPSGGASWSVDATSGIAVPANTTQWSAFIAANALTISTPDSIYLCQESSGNLADSAGSFTLTATGTLGYQQNAAGWARKGVSTSNGVVGRWSSTDAALPDISTTSCMVMFFAITAASASNKVICRLGTTPAAILINSTTPNRFRVISNASSAVSAANDPAGAVRPFVLRERSDVPSTAGFTNQEKLTPAHGAGLTGKKIVLGDDAAASATTTFVYAARWDGVKANVSDAVVKALLQAMGWTIPWT